MKIRKRLRRKYAAMVSTIWAQGAQIAQRTLGVDEVVGQRGHTLSSSRLGLSSCRKEDYLSHRRATDYLS